MTTFDKREEAFERQFALDEELKFKAEARRDRFLGLWAAEKLGKSGVEAQAYARGVIDADFTEAGDANVLQKVLGDLCAGNIAVTEDEIRAKMNEFLMLAAAQVKAGT